ncbi:proton-coupled folate transporter-like [Coccinella septempunctata]|uniref:proton-coupled folate transporter-like n=1 Tax=Coccinella septempunctata TaxID=41139 RepID=UPI001D08C108|nr:proton-coupled folate transporter-like [Coccinella septempunctata]XP_044754807.1 proton-coupled folate transporter-like [Coccinella septempunctata]XP_044754808.1 proton-coupled folate transporter-like [Coccinella septempunctata]
MMREVPPTLEIGSPQQLEIMEPKIEKSSKLEGIKNILRNITVEPIIVLLFTPRLLCSLTNDNLNLEKACFVNLGYNDSICYAMVVRDRSGYTAEQEVAVQKVVSRLLPYKQACHIFQLITILLVSGWSDRTQKRKPMFYLPFIGDMSALVGYMICVYFFMDLGAEYSIFIEGVLTIAFGGFQLLLAGSYSYVASITDDKSRTLRIGIVTIVSRASMTIGIALSGYSFKFLGFYGVYLLSLGLGITGLLYALVSIKNIPAKDRENKQDMEYTCCSQIFDGTLDSFTKCFRICFQKGPNKRRTKMILLQLINYLSFGITTGELAVLYLFTRKEFAWDEVDYSIYKAYRTIIEVAGCTCGLALFSKYLKWSDTTIGMLSIVCRIGGTLFLAFSITGLQFYIGTLHDFFGALTLISVRSMITKIVNQNEQGIANSMTSVIDSVGLFSIGPFFSFIYYNTVAFFPGAFYLVSTSVNIPLLILFYVLHRLTTVQQKDG